MVGDQPDTEVHLSVVVMAGGFSPPPLAEAAGCSPLDLFVSADQTVCDRWIEATRALGAVAEIEDMLCICGGSTPAPARSLGALRVIADESDYRGPAGSLRDALGRTPSASLILVAEAARICNADLRSLLDGHVAGGAAVTVVAHADRSPAGLYLFGRATLDLVPHKGFMDLKEQWLGKVLEAGVPVAVHTIPNGSCPPIRTRGEYIRAVVAASPHTRADPTDSSLEPRTLVGARRTRSIVCRGAEVADEAVVVDSVVMPGAVVEPEALVIRSLVCPDTRVAAADTVIDSVLGPRGLTKDARAQPTESPA